ncbi:uncharacterized protein [Aristolochia californica]|uniref:uncharacterized protein n=1 Tax=Aristolochia californica TaxID=171875 RepID=UPI0035DADC0B
MINHPVESVKMVKAGEGEEQQVYELQGEPAVVINGVPALNADLNESAANNDLDINCDPHLKNNHGFGKALEGRGIRKLFSDQYYFGKVAEFDEETNWYKVVYEDGDFEDLEWHELEEVLLPLDVSISLKQVAMSNYKYDKSIFESGEAAPKLKDRLPKALESTKVPADIQEVTPVTKKRGRPAKKSVHQETPQNVEKRSRGRPRKNPKPETQMQGEKSLPQKRLPGRPRKKQRGRPRKTPQPEIHMQSKISSSAENNLLQAMELPVEVISTEKGSG